MEDRITPLLPREIMELIAEYLPIKERFTLAVNLRLIYIRDKCIPWLQYATMDHASRKGQVDLLTWWKNSSLECKWSFDAMHWASWGGHVSVLEWWKNSELECKWSHVAMDWASFMGHISVLEWWKNSGLKCKWSRFAMDWACNTQVVEWWKNNEAELSRNENLYYPRSDPYIGLLNT